MSAEALGWTVSALRELDTLLRCAICFEYMKTTLVAQGCSHNYCSLCIRRYICYKQQCPTCLEPVVDSDLKNNRIVDQIIEMLCRCRSETLSSNEKTSMNSSCTIPATIATKPSVGEGQQLEHKKSDDQAGSRYSDNTVDGSSSLEHVSDEYVQRPNLIENSDFSSDEAPVPEKSLLEVPAGSGSSTALNKSLASTSFSSVKSSGDARGATMSTSLASTSTFQLQQSGSLTSRFGSKINTIHSDVNNQVPCPVCNVDVPTRNINLHLDRCLTNSNKSSAPQSNKVMRRKPLPKLVYNLLSDKELRKKVAEVGLPIQGDKKLMVQRHREYTLIYNSECDSLNPKSGAEIVKEILKSEGNKAQAVTAVTTIQAMRVEKSASAAEVDAARKTYVQQHKSQFAELIEAARRSRMAAKSKPESNASIASERFSEQNSSVGERRSEPLLIEDSDSSSEFDFFSSVKKGAESSVPATETSAVNTSSQKTQLCESDSVRGAGSSVAEKSSAVWTSSPKPGPCDSDSDSVLVAMSSFAETTSAVRTSSPIHGLYDTGSEVSSMSEDLCGVGCSVGTSCVPHSNRIVGASDDIAPVFSNSLKSSATEKLNNVINNNNMNVLWESSSSLPATQINSMHKSPGYNSEGVQPSPDLIGLVNIAKDIGMPDAQLFDLSDTLVEKELPQVNAKKVVKAVKRKPSRKARRKWSSNHSDDNASDSDDSLWNPDSGAADKATTSKKRKKRSKGNDDNEDSSSSSTDCELSSKRSLRSKGKKTAARNAKKGAKETLTNGNCEPAVELDLDLYVDADENAANRRQSTRVRKPKKRS